LVAEEARRGDADNGKWFLIYVKDGANDGRIGFISLLP
jgi:hypothetical protein